MDLVDAEKEESYVAEGGLLRAQSDRQPGWLGHSIHREVRHTGRGHPFRATFSLFTENKAF